MDDTPRKIHQSLQDITAFYDGYLRPAEERTRQYLNVNENHSHLRKPIDKPAD